MGGRRQDNDERALGRREAMLIGARDRELLRLLNGRRDLLDAIAPNAEELRDSGGFDEDGAKLQALAELGAQPTWRETVEALRREAEEAAFTQHPELTAKVAEERFAAIARFPHVRAWEGPDEEHFGTAPRDVSVSFEAHHRLEGRVWLLRGELEAATDGRRGLLLRRLLIEPEPTEADIGEITPMLLRAIGLPLIRERAVREPQKGRGHGGDASERARLLYAALSEAPPKRGSTGYPPELFELLALLHVRLIGKHGPQGVNTRTARLFSRILGREVKRNTLRSWLPEAETLGFLAKGSEARELGPRFDLDTKEEEHG